MTSTIKKYANLIDLLWEKTKQGRVPWSYDQDTSTVSVWSEDNFLQCRHTSNENRDPLYVITLMNKQGDVLEQFNDETLSGADMSPENEGLHTYFSLMENLFATAQRQATGADVALDNFMKDLSRDALSGPF